MRVFYRRAIEMSDAEFKQQDLSLIDLDGGKRKRANSKPITRRNAKNNIIAGKIYANWCGHCTALEPEWDKMCKIIKQKDKKRRFKFMQIEEKQIATEFPKFKKNHNVDLTADGFPSLFRFANGKVEYYQGNREANQMTEWYLKGGDGDVIPEKQPGPDVLNVKMPGLMEDMQGGKRYRRIRFSKRFHKRRHRQSQRKEPGILSFLFGK